MVDKRIAPDHHVCRGDGQRETDHMEDVLHMVDIGSRDQPVKRIYGGQAFGGC